LKYSDGAAARAAANSELHTLEKTLLLFDIDGTLVTTGGCGEQALRLAVRDELGVEEDMREIEIAGRTDTLIARQLLRKHGRPETEEGIRGILESYLRHLPRLLPEVQGRLLPGVGDLLSALQSRADVVLALLTGNLARGAQHKLSHYGVWHYFEFGAYADDHHERDRLGPFALARAAERGHAVSVSRTFVIGDTPHDISCARAIGAKAVAVATGGFRSENLAVHSPDVLLEDLGDLPASLRAFGL
jgi:phosphoglycolate phosphatase-like HAD superfamily hydrolase